MIICTLYITFKLFQVDAVSAISRQKWKKSVNIWNVSKYLYLVSIPLDDLWFFYFRACITSYLQNLYLQHIWIFIKIDFINRTKLLFLRSKFDIFALFILSTIVSLITVLFMFQVFLETLTSLKLFLFILRSLTFVGEK